MNCKRCIGLVAAGVVLTAGSWLAWRMPFASPAQPYVPYYFYGYIDLPRPEYFSYYDWQGPVVAPVVHKDDVPVHWEPVYMLPSEDPAMDWKVNTSSTLRRDVADAALTTMSPTTLSFFQPIYMGSWDTFRPVFSAGVGVLNQTKEGRSYEAVQQEWRTLLQLGLGAEWRPTDRMIFHLGYDYSRLPVESGLNPDLPVTDHTVRLGVEVKF